VKSGGKLSKSVPVGSPVGQNEPPVPIGSHTQPSEPIGDKNRITSMTIKRAVKEVTYSFETSVDFQRTTVVYIPENNTLQQE
jgi:hypothetical protein